MDWTFQRRMMVSRQLRGRGIRDERVLQTMLEIPREQFVLEDDRGAAYSDERVITVELLPELAAMARENLEKTGRLANITVIAGDGSLGYPAEAPYDAISVAAAAADIPRALLEQLKSSGCMVIPVGPHADQELRVVRKKDGEIDWHVVSYCRFVPLREPARRVD
jgi:protein-L-isoaspartate(D-aspartate) O-methyltransferase